MSEPMIDVELFSGAGGIQLGLSWLGIHGQGYEFWAIAVKSAQANGHNTVQADVAATEPPPRGTVRLLAGGPPYQGFSRAGKGKGREDVPLILETAWAMVADPARAAITLAEARMRMKDHRSALVLEPLRWILACRPRRILLEQVPDVLPLWHLLATLLRQLGYSAWAGKLHAEQYGVPQTRVRAVLLASLDHEVGQPVPTHSRYYSHDRTRLDSGVRRWVTMAEALGWGANGRPSFTVTGGGTASGGAEPFGSQARAGLLAERDAGRWTLGDRRTAKGTIRCGDEPAPTLTASLDNGNTRWALAAGNQAHSAVRELDEPAATLVTGGRVNAVSWVQRSNYSGSGTAPGQTAAERGRSIRTLDEPSVAVTGRVGHWVPDWSTERPATTIAGDSRVWPPGHKVNAADRERHADADERYGNRAGKDAIRITVQEALVLQSFTEAYVIHGNQGESFQQVGNAMPPRLAYACGRELFPELCSAD